MAQVRHIAFCSDHPGKTADFYKEAFGFKELARYGLDPSNPEHAPRPSAVMMTDGHLNIAILKPSEDQTGVGLDHVGFHHWGVVVDDVDNWTTYLEKLGAPNLTTIAQAPRNAHPEAKFQGPDGVVFDISASCWPGAAPVSAESKQLPE